MGEIATLWYKHFLFGFAGSVFAFLLSIWLMVWASEKNHIRYADKLNFKSIVYHILALIGMTGTISFGILGIYEFTYSFILGVKFVCALIAF